MVTLLTFAFLAFRDPDRECESGRDWHICSDFGARDVGGGKQQCWHFRKTSAVGRVRGNPVNRLAGGINVYGLHAEVLERADAPQAREFL